MDRIPSNPESHHHHPHHHHHAAGGEVAEEDLGDELQELRDDFVRAVAGTHFDPDARMSLKQGMVMEEVKYWLEERQIHKSVLEQEWRKATEATVREHGHTLDFDGFMGFVVNLENLAEQAQDSE